MKEELVYTKRYPMPDVSPERIDILENHPELIEYLDPVVPCRTEEEIRRIEQRAAEPGLDYEELSRRFIELAVLFSKLYLIDIDVRRDPFGTVADFHFGNFAAIYDEGLRLFSTLLAVCDSMSTYICLSAENNVSISLQIDADAHDEGYIRKETGE